MNKMFFKEDYVSYEVAKMLKKKGFDWDCITYYVDSEPDDVKYSLLFENNTTWEERCCSAPTHQMVMKWLREQYKIFIEIGVSIDLNGKYHYGFRLLNSICKNILEPKDLVKMGFKDTYEEACEASIKYTLENLI